MRHPATTIHPSPARPRLEDIVPLGAIAAGQAPGREDDAQITVADLTGLGIQDAALANTVVTLAKARGMGQMLAT